jgi:type II secretory pathway pseudopilin PulG
MAQNLRGRRRGYMLLDAVMGLAMVGILTTALVVAINRQHRAEQKLADSRAAVRLAERALAEMQASGKAPARDERTRIEVRLVDGGVDGRDQVWVEVIAASGDSTATLLGLVPRSAIPEGRLP